MACAKARSAASRGAARALGADAFLALERAADPSAHRAPDAPGWHCVALAIPVDEREPWRARLAAGGVPVERETQYTRYARDPDGNLVGLSHHPHACAPPGAR